MTIKTNHEKYSSIFGMIRKEAPQLGAGSFTYVRRVLVYGTEGP